jgi:hypothetical protein
MKKLLLTLGLIGIHALCHAQGIIALGNSALTKIQICENGVLRPATAEDGVRISVFFGPAGTSESNLTPAPGTDAFVIGATPGVLTGYGLLTFALPGTEGGQTVSLQIRMTGTGGHFAMTKVSQVTLTAAPSPGAVIWQPSGATNPNRFTPLISPMVFYCPEPSTLALGALAGAFLLFRLRRSTKHN